MQFKNPEILYALFLLLIPIIVHLFQLRRFQKVPFTNVEFLKSVTIQTRKSQELKKWLILLTRLLLLAAVIFAFAQPYTSENKGLNTTHETVIYLDNSFSMQAKGDKGELLKRALQDIISSFDDDEDLSVITNNEVFRKSTLKSVKNDLLEIDYSNQQLDYDAAILKGRNLFSNSSEMVKNLILISDFQQNRQLPKTTDSLINTYWVQLKPVNQTNLSIDSAYISSVNANTLNLSVVVNQGETSLTSLPISLYNNDELISKTAAGEGTSSEAIFSLTKNEIINGTVSIDDAMLQFDNKLYFNINERDKINVLSINSENADYLRRIYTDDEFNFLSVDLNQLNYNDLNSQNLIILNELIEVPLALNNALSAFIGDGGSIVIIPSEDANLSSYNQLLNRTTTIGFSMINPSEKKITAINYSHPLYKDVFDKEVSNFQFPKVNSFVNVSGTASSILEFEDGNPFLLQHENIYIFTAATNTNNSNVINSPLIVPTMYNIGTQSFKLPKLYYTIGNENRFDVNTSLQQDEIIKLRSFDYEVIPQQRTLTNKVIVTTNEMPNNAGIYEVNKNAEVLQNVSFNYDRTESELNYHDMSRINNFSNVESIPQVINSIKSASNINVLWKWFAIFALVFLITEMLILKFIK
jgi:hypothetical protein